MMIKIAEKIKKIKWVNFLVLAIIFVALMVAITRYNKNYVAAIPLVGDEPTYMAMADSLVTFKTFNLVNEDFLSFIP